MCALVCNKQPEILFGNTKTPHCDEARCNVLGVQYVGLITIYSKQMGATHSYFLTTATLPTTSASMADALASSVLIWLLHKAGAHMSEVPTILHLAVIS